MRTILILIFVAFVLWLVYTFFRSNKGERVLDVVSKDHEEETLLEVRYLENDECWAVFEDGKEVKRCDVKSTAVADAKNMAQDRKPSVVKIYKMDGDLQDETHFHLNEKESGNE